MKKLEAFAGLKPVSLVKGNDELGILGKDWKYGVTSAVSAAPFTQNP